MLAAISGSTTAGLMRTQPSSPAVSVMLCASVKAVSTPAQ